jgi:hypothetical protein
MNINDLNYIKSFSSSRLYSSAILSGAMLKIIQLQDDSVYAESSGILPCKIHLNSYKVTI